MIGPKTKEQHDFEQRWSRLHNCLIDLGFVDPHELWQVVA